MEAIRQLWLIAITIFIEAVRRKEIYAVVLIALLMISALRFVQFFDVEGLGKFYREIALRIMNISTGLTVIVLASRQLPREFKNRTLYPLLAKPVSRFTFLMGKFTGVMLAAAFCYGIFMVIFLLANLTIKTPLNYGMFLQSVYLQLWSLAILAGLGFLLSLLLNTDAAVTVGSLLFFGSQVFLSALTYLQGSVEGVQAYALKFLLYFVPQLTLFDASARVVHGTWEAVSTGVMVKLTTYGLVYLVVYMGAAFLIFRRRPL